MRVRYIDLITDDHYDNNHTGLGFPAASFDTNGRWFRLLARYSLLPKERAELWVAESETGKADLAIVPVRIAASGQSLSALSNFYTAYYEPWLLATDVAGLTAIVHEWATTHRYACLDFRPMDPHGFAYRQLRHSMSAAGFISFPYFCFGNWFLPVLNRSFRDYAASLPGKIRNTIKRKHSRFEAAGGRLDVVVGGPQLHEAIAAYQQVYAASWKRPEPFPEFMPALMRACAAQGWLRLGVAWLKDQPVAAQCWILYGGRASIYKLAYDEQFSAYSAGTLLTAHLMERALDHEGVEEVDYLAGDDPYKRDWMSGRRERWGLIGYNSRTVAGLAGLLSTGTRTIIKRLLGRSRTPAGTIINPVLAKP
jgi:hypothetical protein